MKVEQQLTALENEASALKATFERLSTSVPVYTKTATAQTSANLAHYHYYSTDWGETLDYDIYLSERLRVTLATDSGIDTIATIEVTCNNADSPAPSIRRVNYDGGARWIISNSAYFGNNGWQPTIYHIAVHSMADGKLSVEGVAS